MLWEGLERDEWRDHHHYYQGEDPEGQGGAFGFDFDFDFLSLLSQHKDYYKILEVDYDATEEIIRSNYIRLALKWHPDKRKDDKIATSRFQEINEAYKVLSNPIKRQEYDRNGILYVQDHNITEYLNRHKNLILTCNGLGIRFSLCYIGYAAYGRLPVAKFCCKEFWLMQARCS